MIKQISYYGDGNKANFPEGLKKEELASGANFSNITCSEICINSEPRTKLFINGQEIVIGSTGFYNISADEHVEIYSIKVDEDSLNKMNSSSNFLIITFIQKN